MKRSKHLLFAHFWNIDSKNMTYFIPLICFSLVWPQIGPLQKKNKQINSEINSPQYRVYIVQEYMLTFLGGLWCRCFLSSAWVRSLPGSYQRHCTASHDPGCSSLLNRTGNKMSTQVKVQSGIHSQESLPVFHICFTFKGWMILHV